MSDPLKSVERTNRLAQESSPYLLQHAHNPVDWYAWGPEAFEAARKENKPIFLSVGYSTCYWCHVMERESFENDAVAAEMNHRFINIKVDREERPDVDQLYMTAVQVLTRHGGWPMSVFLLPDLRPFYGGTYFPPDDSRGRPGFVTLLRGIEDAYHHRPAEVEKTAAQLVKILGQYAEPSAAESPIEIDDAFVEGMIRRSTSDYDPKFGGFGGAPKFPRETLLELLLVYLRSPESDARMKSKVLHMVRHTLDALADGGIRDQLGGGFHRYSTDARWLVPHFEIMLYDNAMLAWCYVEAFVQTKEPRYSKIARGVFDFILREMTSPQGAFYTALDAEVDSQEGLNYLWTKQEVESLLGKEDAQLFNRVYGVEEGPNFADPHHGSGNPDKNILFFPHPLEDAAIVLKTDIAALESRLEPMRKKLLDARMKRKQPLLDTKIITSWNALMIRALAYGGLSLQEPRYSLAARTAAEFLLRDHRTPDGRLFRTSRDGKAKYRGFLDDYAFLIQALLELAAAENNASWKEQAGTLALTMIDQFGDLDHGGFYFTEKAAKDLIVRQKTASDSPLPSGNAVAAMCLLELGHVAIARQTLALFAHQTEAQGEGMSSMVQANLQYLRQAGAFTVSAVAQGAHEHRPLSVDQIAQSVVEVRTMWAGQNELHVQLTIQRGYHINAHELGENLQLIATTVSVDAAEATVEYPVASELKLSFMDKPLRVYDGAITATVRFAASRKLDTPVTVTLTYQACNDLACLPPVTKRIEAK